LIFAIVGAAQRRAGGVAPYDLVWRNGAVGAAQRRGATERPRFCANSLAW